MHDRWRLLRALWPSLLWHELKLCHRTAPENKNGITDASFSLAFLTRESYTGHHNSVKSANEADILHDLLSVDPWGGLFQQPGAEYNRLHGAITWIARPHSFERRVWWVDLDAVKGPCSQNSEWLIPLLQSFLLGFYHLCERDADKGFDNAANCTDGEVRRLNQGQTVLHDKRMFPLCTVPFPRVRRPRRGPSQSERPPLHQRSLDPVLYLRRNQYPSRFLPGLEFGPRKRNKE